MSYFTARPSPKTLAFKDLLMSTTQKMYIETMTIIPKSLRTWMSEMSS
jgi:hypothetical protein